jgi:hypothetical protein
VDDPFLIAEVFVLRRWRKVFEGYVEVIGRNWIDSGLRFWKLALFFVD